MANYGGFTPKRDLSGMPYNGACNLYTVPASDGTAMFIGDLVKLAGSSSTFGDGTYADVIQWTQGGVAVGAVVGFHPDTRDSLTYRAASTLRGVFVADNPNLLFQVPEIDSGTALAAADIGLNANVTVGTGNTTTGLSAMQVNNATEATTNTLDIKLVGFENTPNNAVGTTSPGAQWLVRINRHQYVDQVAGV